jgi:two-component system sensor histidine kinase KdpD
MLFGLRQKLSLGFGGLFLIILIIGVQSIVKLSELGQSIDVILRENYRSVIACQDMKESIERIDSGALFTLLGYEQEGATLITDNLGKFEKALRLEGNNITVPGERESFGKLDQLYHRYQTVLEQVREPSAPAEARRALYFEQLFPLFKEVKDTADTILHLNQENMSEANDAARTKAALARQQMYLWVLCGSGIAIAFVFFTGRWILRPISRLIGSANEIKQGNLDLVVASESFGFALQIALWLWFTVLFANFAEAMAEGRGKAQADALRKTRTQTIANKILAGGTVETVPAQLLRKDDRFLVSAGELIPADGEIVEGVATVDESAITGESAPVIREAGGDRSAVTGGTRVLSDQIKVRVTANPGESFLDRMIRLVEGVGKTYQMLQEGHRLKADGIDAVVGLVETHGREETAKLIESLEVIPRTHCEYRGVAIEEMDVDAVLARKPEVALIDELAHTNIPGSRNAKRYEDVQDILEAGIHVITTLNVQHMESLYDTVETATGVKVRERIPDSVLGEADQIVNVDLTTEDLQRRLREGKIYPLERIETALGNFFVRPNLEQLREITLRELASQIDLRRREPEAEDTKATEEQVLVCLSSGGPNSERLLRYASRLAGRLNGNWYALYVQTPSEEPTAIDAGTQRILASTLTLAKQLGAMVFTYKGEDVPDTILRFTREYRVGHIVVGNPGPLPFWKKWTGKRSIVERLIDNAEGITIVLLDTRKTKQDQAAPAVKSIAPKHAPAPGSAPSLPTFSTLLTADRIVIWEESVLKEEVLNALTHAALKDADKGQLLEASRRVWDREQLGSTFFNEGVAFPHARLDGLETPRLALGLTRQGIVDVATEKPIEIVFLILTPSQSPSTQLQLLAMTSRAAQNRHLLQRMRAYASPQDILNTVVSWEQLQQDTVGE